MIGGEGCYIALVLRRRQRRRHEGFERISNDSKFIYPLKSFVTPYGLLRTSGLQQPIQYEFDGAHPEEVHSTVTKGGLLRTSGIKAPYYLIKLFV